MKSSGVVMFALAIALSVPARADDPPENAEREKNKKECFEKMKPIVKACRLPHRKAVKACNPKPVEEIYEGALSRMKKTMEDMAAAGESGARDGCEASIANINDDLENSVQNFKDNCKAKREDADGCLPKCNEAVARLDALQATCRAGGPQAGAEWRSQYTFLVKYQKNCEPRVEGRERGKFKKVEQEIAETKQAIHDFREASQRQCSQLEGSAGSLKEQEESIRRKLKGIVDEDRAYAAYEDGDDEWESYDGGGGSASAAAFGGPSGGPSGLFDPQPVAWQPSGLGGGGGADFGGSGGGGTYNTMSGTPSESQMIFGEPSAEPGTFEEVPQGTYQLQPDGTYRLSEEGQARLRADLDAAQSFTPSPTEPTVMLANATLPPDSNFFRTMAAVPPAPPVAATTPKSAPTVSPDAPAEKPAKSDSTGGGADRGPAPSSAPAPMIGSGSSSSAVPLSSSAPVASSLANPPPAPPLAPPLAPMGAPPAETLPGEAPFESSVSESAPGAAAAANGAGESPRPGSELPALPATSIGSKSSAPALPAIAAGVAPVEAKRKTAAGGVSPAAETSASGLSSLSASFSTDSTGGGGKATAAHRPWWRPSFMDSLFGGDKPSAPERREAASSVDLSRFLPGQRAAGSAARRRSQGIHGSETVLWNAVRGRYHSLEPSLIDDVP